MSQIQTQKSRLYSIFNTMINSHTQINLVKSQLFTSKQFNLAKVFKLIDCEDHGRLTFVHILQFFARNSLSINQHEAKNIIRYFTNKNQIEKHEFFAGITPYPLKYYQKNISCPLEQIITKLLMKIMDQQQQIFKIKAKLNKDLYFYLFQAITQNKKVFTIQNLINFLKTYKKNVNLHEITVIMGQKTQIDFIGFTNLIKYSEQQKQTTKSSIVGHAQQFNSVKKVEKKTSITNIDLKSYDNEYYQIEIRGNKGIQTLGFLQKYPLKRDNTNSTSSSDLKFKKGQSHQKHQVKLSNSRIQNQK